MKKNITYIFTGVIVLVALIIGYHYYAAGQAEQQISKTISAFSQKHNKWSVQVTSVDVDPFAADISIKNINVISADHIERAKQLKLDISYWDILNGYAGGVEYGLRHLSNVKLQALRPSYTNISGPQEFKADSLMLKYNGNFLKSVKALRNNKKLEYDNTLQLNAKNTVTVLAGKNPSSIKTRHLKFRAQLNSGKKPVADQVKTHLEAEQIIWSPSQAIQQQYSFMIKGLGYPVDAIPFKSANLSTKPDSGNGKVSVTAALSSELALFKSSGNLQLTQPAGRSKISDAQINVSKFSEKFSNILQNLEQLFSVSFDRSKNGIQLKLTGTIANPKIKRE